MKGNDLWFVDLYEALRPAVTGMARNYARVWGVEADDLVQVAGYALWTQALGPALHARLDAATRP